jgi:hypothetical protein
MTPKFPFLFFVYSSYSWEHFFFFFNMGIIEQYGSVIDHHNFYIFLSKIVPNLQSYKNNFFFFLLEIQTHFTNEKDDF